MDSTYEELELVKEGICQPCKGVFYFHDFGCYEKCEEFQKELIESRKEN